jgi:glycosyltransferase involved in cell wall biosynthesis
MRVLVASTSFPISPGSASGVFVKRLTDELKRYCNVEVVVPSDSMGVRLHSSYCIHCFRYAPRRFQILAHKPGGLPVALRQHSCAVLLIPVFITSFLFSLWKLSKNKDLLFANWSVSGFLAGIAGRLRGVPVCTTFRGEDVSSLESSRFRTFLVSQVLRLNTRVVCVSDATHRDLRALFPEYSHKIAHIPNGVGNDFLRIEPHFRISGGLKLVSIGSLIPRKNIQTVLRALARTEKSVTLDIVGDGPEKENLLSLAEELQIASRVRFRGQVNSSEMAELIGQYDVLVLASLSEGRPNVVLEAMAAARCVVCSRLPGTEELISHEVSGLLFDSTDSVMLATYYNRLLHDKCLCREFGRKARQSIIEKKLTWDGCGKHYYDMFCKIT